MSVQPRGCWYNSVGCIERKLDDLFEKWGRVVAKHPGKIILFTTLFGALCSAGIILMQPENQSENLFAPQNTIEYKNFLKYRDLFGSSDFGWGQVILTTKRPGTNMLTETVLTDVQNLHKKIVAVKSSNGRTFSSMCFKDIPTKKCSIQCVLEFYNFNVSSANFASTKLYGPRAFSSYRGSGLNMKTLLGHPTVYVSQPNTTLTYATTSPALKCAYFLDASIHTESETTKWEFKFLETMKQEKANSRVLNIDYQALRSFEDELAASIQSDVSIFASAITLLSVFSSLVLLRFKPGKCCCLNFQLDSFREKAGVSLFGLLSVILAIGSSFGICGAIGVRFNSVVSITPFLMLGLGVDDMFVIVRAFELADPNSTVEDRIAETVRRAGVSILYTSLTDLCAFLAGMSSSFGAVRAFCVYAGVGVFLDFIYQITFFLGFLVLETRYKYSRSCSDIVCCKEYEDEDHEGYDTDTTTIMTPFGKFILQWQCKIIILILFAGYVGVAVYGVTTLRAFQDLVDLAPSDSHLAPYYTVNDKHFNELGPPIEVVFPNEEAYHTQATQTKVSNILVAFEDDSCFEQNTSRSWLQAYTTFRTTPANFVNGSTLPASVSATASSGVINEWYNFLNSTFLASSRGQQYKKHMKFTKSNGNLRISTSTVYVSMIPTGSGTRVMARCLPQIRSIQKTHSSMFPYWRAFIFAAADLETVPQTIQNLGLAAASGFIVTLILIPYPLVSIFVMYTVAQILLGVLGYMSLWDLPINTTTMINVVISIGFSVDNTAHIVHAYMTAPFATREERVIFSLEAVGLPVILGDMSTVLAMLPLTTASSQIFISFTKCIVLVMIFGAGHAVLFLPVVLSLIGPKTHFEDHGGASEARDNLDKRRESEMQPVQTTTQSTGESTGQSEAKPNESRTDARVV